MKRIILFIAVMFGVLVALPNMAAATGGGSSDDCREREPSLTQTYNRGDDCEKEHETTTTTTQPEVECEVGTHKNDDECVPDETTTTTTEPEQETTTTTVVIDTCEDLGTCETTTTTEPKQETTTVPSTTAPPTTAPDCDGSAFCDTVTGSDQTWTMAAIGIGFLVIGESIRRLARRS